MIKAFKDYMIGEKKSMNTINAYCRDVWQMLNYINKAEADIEYADLLNWKSSISSLASSTVHRKITAVKGYFDFLIDIDMITVNPAAKIKNVKIKSKEKLPLNEDEIKAMMKVCVNKRQKAMIYMLGATGLRISELTGLTLEQYKNRINNKIIVNGKGDKDNIININHRIADIVDDYIDNMRSEYPAMSNSKYLFPSFKGNQMTTCSIDASLKSIAKRAGIADWKHVSAHTFRHSFATIMLNKNVGIDIIQVLMNHSNIQTTRRYAKTDENRLIAAVNTINI